MWVSIFDLYFKEKKPNSCMREILRKVLMFSDFYISNDVLTIFVVSLLLKTSIYIMRYMAYMKNTLTLILPFATNVAPVVTVPDCSSRHLSFPWGSPGSTRSRHVINYAACISIFIG